MDPTMNLQDATDNVVVMSILLGAMTAHHLTTLVDHLKRTRRRRYPFALNGQSVSVPRATALAAAKAVLKVKESDDEPF